MTLSETAITELTKVFEYSNMIAVTEKYYFYDLNLLILQATADQNTTRALYKTEVNFWQCLVKPTRVLGAATTVHKELQIELTYTRQIDVAAKNYQTVADAYELFMDSMVATIGYRWADLINIYQVSTASAINILQMAEKDCWQTNFSINATI
jgi:hypothetical protein